MQKILFMFIRLDWRGFCLILETSFPANENITGGTVCLYENALNFDADDKFCIINILSLVNYWSDDK